MTTVELLEKLKARGLSIEMGDDGKPRVIGPKALITVKLLKVLPFHREEIIRRLAPKLQARRVVLVNELGSDSVLWSGPAGNELEVCRERAMLFPGRVVAAEWSKNGEWIRFIEIRGRA